ncbi:MAG: decarboxylating 6-phosphogluconate dehydrogenase [Candidatus Eisenbacteria bacterium]|nr:decarboxylating 6-phosphogluconate dehydrogenase [Candidatus Eisenbacteria bacterium]
MKVGMVGLGRMGANMVTRLLRGGHSVVAFDRKAASREAAQAHGAVPAETIPRLVELLERPRSVWIMVPSGAPVDEVLGTLHGLLSPGDTVIDGGNSNYRDSMRRAGEAAAKGLRFMDAGTSGGIWGLEKGYCMMVGAEPDVYAHHEPLLKTLAPPDGCMHVGPPGAGHYVKMIHNGIEYGMLQAYGEGFEILKASPFPLDLGAISHLWNQGSVVRSWLLELAERAFAADPELEQIRGYVEDSGEGRWTVQEAMDLSVPAPVLTLSLLARFRSRQDESFGAKVIAALRNEFGGHAVRKS